VQLVAGFIEQNCARCAFSSPMVKHKNSMENNVLGIFARIMATIRLDGGPTCLSPKSSATISESVQLACMALQEIRAIKIKM
jgi:hypothetical protein